MSSTNKSCYRLYAGHGNWINLNAKTTADLLEIFQKGVPCRYQLSPGLAIDIIPHDVDCNSKNIDMFGLMRADLVYETQVAETQVQQLMSHYIRNLLDDQGIIDAFPPLRVGEDLPIITSIPTHRHLSLVPSVVGAVRRGPKPNSLYKNAIASANQEDTSMLSSSSATSVSSSPSRVNKKRNSYGTKRSNNNNKKNQIVELIQANKRPENMSEIQLFNESQNQAASYMDTSSPSEQVYHTSGNTSYPMLNYPHPPNPWSNYQQARQGNTVATNTNNTNFSFEFDFNQGQGAHQHNQRESPTDILHEYEYQRFGHPNTNEMYHTGHTIIDEKPAASSNDSTGSYVPTSPCWESRDDWEYRKLTTKSNSSDEEIFKNDKQVTTGMERIILSSSNLILSHSPQ